MTVQSDHFVLNHYEHPLVPPSLARHLPKNRVATESQLEIARCMHYAGMTNTQILDTMQRMYPQDSVQPFTKNKKDLDNLFQVPCDLVHEDAQRLCDHLHSMRNQDCRYVFEKEVDDDGTLLNVLWATPSQVNEYMKYHDVVTFDTKAKSSTSRLFFAAIIAINGEGKIVPVCQALLHRERACNFSWMFENFLKHFGAQPDVIFTDGDKAMAKAIKAVLPMSKHLLCLYHINKNIAKHCKGALGDKWDSFIRGWWKIVNNTDIRSAATINEEFHRLLVDHNIADLCTSEGTHEEGMEDVLEDKDPVGCAAYMRHLWRLRKVWAKRFTHEYVTRGISSTQRSEALHHMLGKFINHNTPLREYVHKYDKLLNSIWDTIDAGMLKRIYWLPRLQSCFPEEKEAYEYLTAYACAIVIRELKETPMYQSFPFCVHCQSFWFPNGCAHPFDHWYSVRRMNASCDKKDQDHDIEIPCIDEPFHDRLCHVKPGEQVYCTCQFPTCMGLFCRHVLECRHHHYNVWKLCFDSIPTRWLEKPSLAIIEKGFVAKLHRTVVPSSTDSAYTPTMSRELYNQLWHEGRELARLACENQQAGTLALQRVKEAMQEASQIINGDESSKIRTPMPKCSKKRKSGNLHPTSQPSYRQDRSKIMGNK